MLLGQAAQLAEVGARVLGVVRPGGHGHQACQAQVRTSPDGVDESVEPVRRDAALRGLLAEFDLQHHLHTRACRTDSRGEFRRVDGLDHLKQLDGAPDLVRLQVTDEMEARVGQVRQLARLGFEFLDVVLAEVAQAPAHRPRG